MAAEHNQEFSHQSQTNDHIAGDNVDKVDDDHDDHGDEDYNDVDDDDYDDDNAIFYDAEGTPMIDPCFIEDKITKHLKQSDNQTGKGDTDPETTEKAGCSFWPNSSFQSISELEPRFKPSGKEAYLHPDVIPPEAPCPKEATGKSAFHLPPKPIDDIAPNPWHNDVAVRQTLTDKDPDFRLSISGRSVTQNIKVWGAIELSLVPNSTELFGYNQQRHAIADETDQRLPSDWPSVHAMTAPIRVTPCSARSELIKTLWRLPNVYSMRKRTRGRCLIISNKYFYGPVQTTKSGVTRCILPTRHGTDKDVDDLSALFRQLHFDVAVERDCTVQQMHEVLATEASRPSNSFAECFICIICSHGMRAGIYGVGGDVITLEQVTEYFDATHCPRLQGRPKLFFIQACGGDDKTTLVDEMPCGVFGDDRCDSAPDMEICDDFVPVQQPLLTQLQQTPTMADMLVACSTHPGYVSIRNTTYGSWFLQAVVCVFQKHACDESLQDLLTMVNQLVARGRAYLDGRSAENGPTMQVSKFESSLTKKFFFFPGVVENWKEQTD